VRSSNVPTELNFSWVGSGRLHDRAKGRRVVLPLLCQCVCGGARNDLLGGLGAGLGVVGEAVVAVLDRLSVEVFAVHVLVVGGRGEFAQSVWCDIGSPPPLTVDALFAWLDMLLVPQQRRP